MKLKNLSYQEKSFLALGLVMAFIGIGASWMMMFSVIPPVENAVAALASVNFSEHASTTIPVRIMIPKIAVSAELEYVDITLSGAMGAPKNPVNAGWFALGPRPGEKGNAIIDGHYGWKNNIAAAFDNLTKVAVGDKIYVEDERGYVTVFIVKKTQVFGEKDSASPVFNSKDDKAHLNLITCGGVWDKAAKSYSTRLVVFADLVE